MIILYLQTKEGLEQVFPKTSSDFKVKDPKQIEEVVRTAQYIAAFPYEQIDEVKVFGPNYEEKVIFDAFSATYPSPDFFAELARKIEERFQEELVIIFRKM